MVSVDILNERASAEKEIVDSIRDLFTLKITLPLGNPNFKLIHTNQFVFLDLPEGIFELANFSTIAEAMNSTYNRWTDYQVNRWYIEAVTINNDGNKATMELTLNPFPSSLVNYKDNFNTMVNAYRDAISQKNNNNNNNNSSTNNKTKLPGGEGKYIDNLVKKIVGNETDLLKRAKLIYNHLRNYLKYSYYSNSKFSSAEKAYKHKKLNCADTSRVNASMLRSAGVKCYVVHTTNHYYTIVKINGKLYASDPLGVSTKHAFNTHYTVNGWRKFKGKSDYNKVCGDNPCS